MALGVATLGLVVLAAQPAAGQVRFGIGASWGSDTELGLSGRLLLPLGWQIEERPVTGQLSLDWYLDPCDAVDCSAIEITPAVHVPLTIEGLRPHAGAGLSIMYTSRSSETLIVDSSDTDVGIALLGGLTFPLGSMTGQGEGRLTLGGNEQLVLSFSILFGSH
jgi:hypothetical protein